VISKKSLLQGGLSGGATLKGLTPDDPLGGVAKSNKAINEKIRAGPCFLFKDFFCSSELGKKNL
jgi:hypothetical protein